MDIPLKYPNPIYNVTKGDMVIWLDKMLTERAALPDEQQMRDDSGIVISALKHLLSEFEDDEDVMHMLGRLPWVD